MGAPSETRPQCADECWCSASAENICWICVRPTHCATSSASFQRHRCVCGDTQRSYLQALETLQASGFGVARRRPDSTVYFVKRHCRWLPASGPEVSGSAGLHMAWFGAHILPAQLRTLAPYEFGAASASAEAANPPNTQDSGARPPADQQVPPSRPEAVVEQRGNEAGVPETARQQTLPQGDTRQDSGTSGQVALDVSIEWTLLREEGRQRRFQSYDAFREAVEKCLGEAKDPGIYKFHDQSTEKQDKLFAHCRENACANCTRKVKTAFSGDLFCVWVKGQHQNQGWQQASKRQNQGWPKSQWQTWRQLRRHTWSRQLTGRQMLRGGMCPWIN